MIATIAMIATIGKNRAAMIPMTTLSRIQAPTSRTSAASAVRPNDLEDVSFIALTSLDGNGPGQGIRSLSGRVARAAAEGRPRREYSAWLDAGREAGVARGIRRRGLDPPPAA